MIRAKSSPVINSKVKGFVDTETNATLVMILRYVLILWDKSVIRDSIVALGMSIKVAPILTWASAFMVNHANSNISCESSVGTTCTDFVRKEQNVPTRTLRYLSKKISKERRNSLSSYPRSSRNSISATIAHKSDIRWANALRRLNFSQRMCLNADCVGTCIHMLMTATIKLDLTIKSIIHIV